MLPSKAFPTVIIEFCPHSEGEMAANKKNDRIPAKAV